MSRMLVCGAIALLSLACSDDPDDKSGNNAGGVDTGGDVVPDDTGMADTGSQDIGTDAGGMDLASNNGGVVNATMEPNCAPDDGTAITLRLIDGEASCDVDLNNVGHTRIELYDGATTHFPVMAGTTFELATDGFATKCEPLSLPTPCDPATAGTVTFDAFEDGVSGSGTWTITFETAGELSGTFDAIWCEPATPLVCG